MIRKLNKKFFLKVDLRTSKKYHDRTVAQKKLFKTFNHSQNRTLKSEGVIRYMTSLVFLWRFPLIWWSTWQVLEKPNCFFPNWFNCQYRHKTSLLFQPTKDIINQIEWQTYWQQNYFQLFENMLIKLVVPCVIVYVWICVNVYVWICVFEKHNAI